MPAGGVGTDGCGDNYKKNASWTGGLLAQDDDDLSTKLLACEMPSRNVEDEDHAWVCEKNAEDPNKTTCHPVGNSEDI